MHITYMTLKIKYGATDINDDKSDEKKWTEDDGEEILGYYLKYRF